MRFLSISAFTSALSSALVAITVTLLVTSVSGAPATPPRFEVILSGIFDLGAVETIEGPLGTRLHAVVNGGNLTDPSGTLVAKVLPTVDFGVISKSGIFFPEAALGIRWEVDGKLAYLHATGVGSLFESDLSYAHLETDSETWSGLNSRFLVANVSGPAEAPIYTLFGAL